MKPIVRVLIVTDDHMGIVNGGFLKWKNQPMPEAVGPNSRQFHLGEFIKVLQQTVWVGFDLEITKAHRSPAGTGGLNEAELKADRGADVVGFRFNHPFTVNGISRTLADYDMVLFFPINAANPNSQLTAEAEAIASYMEKGGGFFATGDHANLGAELAGLIPRVRSMRRWWSPGGPNGEPGAPFPAGPDRIDTTRPGTDGVGQFEDQSDEIAQEIKPKLYNGGLGFDNNQVSIRTYPHPLLCSPEGMVTYLPDHMHEGLCEVPNKLAARKFNIGTATLNEYPNYIPPNAPSNYVPQPLSPELVATGEVLPGIKSPAIDPEHTGSPDPANGKTFGVICAWDGHCVGKGRVVVDSTWHHFFNINLTGDRFLKDEDLPPQHLQKLHGFYVPNGKGGREPNNQYRMIRWYYRNIVYWLIPADRYQGILWDTLVQFARQPQFLEELTLTQNVVEFEKLSLGQYVYFGQLAEKYFAKARGACSALEVHVDKLYKPKIPWWEWIQRYVDIWNPVEQVRTDDRFKRAQLLGALGVGPRPEIAATLSLGAAIVAAAYAQRKSGPQVDSQRTTKAAQQMFPKVLNHAVSQFGKNLAFGAEMQKELQQVIDKQIREGDKAQ